MTSWTRIAPIALLALVGLAAMATTAIAQDDKRPEREARPERPMLAGPKVREQRVPGVESGFSAQTGLGSRMGGQTVPPQVFRRAIGDLMAQDAPQEIRLSPEQRERITAHVRDFEKDIRQGRGERARPQPGREGKPGDRQMGEPDRRPGRDRPKSNSPEPRSEREEKPRPEDRATRERTARAVAAVQTRVWAELSAAQQAHVAEAIEAWRADAADEQTDRRRDRYRREIGARFDAMDGERPRRSDRGDEPRGTDADGGRTELRAQLSRLPEDARRRVLERVESMSDEQRAQFLRRLRQRHADDSSPKQPK